MDRPRLAGSPILSDLSIFTKGIREAAGTAALHIPSDGDDKEGSFHIETHERKPPGVQQSLSI